MRALIIAVLSLLFVAPAQGAYFSGLAAAYDDSFTVDTSGASATNVYRALFAAGNNDAASFDGADLVLVPDGWAETARQFAILEAFDVDVMPEGLRDGSNPSARWSWSMTTVGAPSIDFNNGYPTAAHGVTYYNCDFAIDGANARGLYLDEAVDVNFVNCTFTFDMGTTAGGLYTNIGIFADTGAGAPGRDVDFTDCTFTFTGEDDVSTMFDLDGSSAPLSGWTFTRTTFDWSALRHDLNGALLRLRDVDDLTFDACTFLFSANHNSGANNTGIVIDSGTSGGNRNNGIRFWGCTFQQPTTYSGSWNAVVFQDFADSTEFIGNTIIGPHYDTDGTGVYVDGVEWEETGGADKTTFGLCIGNKLTGLTLPVVFAEGSQGLVAAHNYIRGLGKDQQQSVGIYFQDAKGCFAIANTIESVNHGIRWAEGDDAGTTAARNHALGNKISDAQTGFLVSTAGSDSASVVVGNLLSNVDYYACDAINCSTDGVRLDPDEALSDLYALIPLTGSTSPLPGVYPWESNLFYSDSSWTGGATVWQPFDVTAALRRARALQHGGGFVAGAGAGWGQ